MRDVNQERHVQPCTQIMWTSVILNPVNPVKTSPSHSVNLVNSVNSVKIPLPHEHQTLACSPLQSAPIREADRRAQPPCGTGGTRAAAVAEIIATVRKEGDDALVKYTKKWDGVDMSRGSLCCPRARRKPPPAVRDGHRLRAEKYRGLFQAAQTAQLVAHQSRGRDGRREIRSAGARRHLCAGRHRAAGFHRADDRAAGQGSRRARNRRDHAAAGQ